MEDHEKKRLQDAADAWGDAFAKYGRPSDAMGSFSASYTLGVKPHDAVMDWIAEAISDWYQHEKSLERPPELVLERRKKGSALSKQYTDDRLDTAMFEMWQLQGILDISPDTAAQMVSERMKKAKSSDPVKITSVKIAEVSEADIPRVEKYRYKYSTGGHLKRIWDSTENKFRSYPPYKKGRPAPDNNQRHQCLLDYPEDCWPIEYDHFKTKRITGKS